ncbi:uncharacterized protein LOC144808027 [Lissotriton helveticus]
MDSPRLYSFLLTVITGTVFPGHILGAIPVTENSLKEAVLPPFVDALGSLTSVAETLRNNTNLAQVIENVRPLLESTHKSLTKAEEACTAQVLSLSANMQDLHDKTNRLNKEENLMRFRKEVYKELLTGSQSQKSLASQLETSKEELQNATDAMDRATQTWYDALEERKRGIGMLFIPYAGPVVGNMIISKAKETQKNAEKELREARSLRITIKYDVNYFESKILSTERDNRSNEENILANRAQFQALQQDLNSERELHKIWNNFLVLLSKCTSLLSTVAAKTSPESMSPGLSELLDGLLGILNEIAVAFRPLVKGSSDYSSLISGKLQTVIQKLEEANRGLKKAAAS